MRKNLTEIVFILDRSGSMSGLEADTIGDFNSMSRNKHSNDFPRANNANGSDSSYLSGPLLYA